jgi:hypothetical protein
MKFLQHPDCTRVVCAPKSWSQVGEVECGALPVMDTVMGDLPAVASFWLPDKAELACLMAGMPLVVMVAGKEHQPLLVGVVDEVARKERDKRTQD